MNQLPLTWQCDICHRERPDAAISVQTNDVSADFGLRPGTVNENIKYCNDNDDCIEKAKTFHLFPLTDHSEVLSEREHKYKPPEG